MKLSSGKWVGMYSYVSDFDYWIEENAVPFELIFESSSASFNGWIREDESKGGIKGDAPVTGIVTGDNIEFTKSYPNRGHQVFDSGKWDFVSSSFKRQWEIKHCEIVGYVLIFYNGIGVWLMRHKI